MSCLRLASRSGEPTAPRKYLLVTMLTAFTDQKSGNSTPRCSKLTDPSRQLVMTTSRRSHATSSYGCTPGVVWTRSIRRPLFLLPLEREPRAGPLVVSVIPPPCTGENALMCPFLPGLGVSVFHPEGRCAPGRSSATGQSAAVAGAGASATPSAPDPRS